MAPSRQARAGTYDNAWLANRHPALPEDCDWRIFNAAPEDQWIDGFFAGDEPFEIVGMSARHPRLKGHLPAMRVRCFVNKRVGEASELIELTAPRIDTVWLFGSEHRGAVIYRTATRIEDIDGADVADIMIAYERAEEPPRTAEHYREVHRLRTDPKTKALYAFSESQLAPMPSAEELAERQQRRDAAAAAELAKRDARLARQHRRMIEDSGLPASMFPPPPKAEPSPFPVITRDDIERMDFDLADMMKAADQLTASMKAKAEAARGDAAKMVADQQPMVDFAKLGLAADLPPGSEAARLQATMADALSPNGLDDLLADLPPETQEEGRRKLAAALAKRPVTVTGDDIERLKRSVHAKALGLPDPDDPIADARRMLEQAEFAPPPIDLAEEPEELREIAASALARAEAAPKARDPARMQAFLEEMGLADATGPPPGDALEGPRIEPAKRAAIEQRIGAALPGLAGPDGRLDIGALGAAIAQCEVKHASAAPSDPVQAKADALAKLDAANAAVAPGIAQARRLSPEPLAPAEKLPPEVATYLGAVILDELGAGRSLAGRDLAGAALAGQNLSGVDLTGALLEGADLRYARLAGSILEDAALTGAQLDGANLSGARLARANLSKASLRGATLTGVDLSGIQLLEADFGDADLSNATFFQPIALKARFGGARLDGARCRDGMFVECDFSQASLADAKFTNCMFIKTTFTEVRAPRADLKRCSFTEVTAVGCDFEAASLERCAALPGTSFARSVFRRASAPKSSWQGVDLIGCDFRDARLDEANFGEARLNGARLDWASLRRSVLASANLEDADLTGADLFEALLRRAKLSRASLRAANLYSANLDDAVLDLADLTDAGLTKTHLLRATDAD
jgi:uncharacterized protein YjbI with pentapeptide repeats